MDNSLSFFRVFDLAFFAPGMLLFGVIWYSGCFPIDTLSSHDDTVHGILTGAFAVVFIYVLGLICHGIQRAVRTFYERFCTNEKQTTQENTKTLPWYAQLKKDCPGHELAMYFWYMSSTCWNLTVASVIVAFASSMILIFQNKLALALFAIFLSVIAIIILSFLANEFERSMRKAVNSSCFADETRT